MKKISLRLNIKMEKVKEFKDVQFMTAVQKRQVLNNWKTFLKYGMQKRHFTKTLYNHLHLHCGFIAHYNIHGFYSTYFESAADTAEFFSQLCSPSNYWSNDYDDINKAMIAKSVKV